MNEAKNTVEVLANSAENTAEVPANSAENTAEIPANSSDSAFEIPANSSENAASVPANSSEDTARGSANSSESATDVSANSSDSAADIPANSSESATDVSANSSANPSRQIQWHAGFCSAMQLELRAQWPVLDFYREYTLSKKALFFDLLVVRKAMDVPIENEVGSFFRKHNILEFKSPDDEMGIDAYFKALAYACFYKVDSSVENGIPAEDITISLVRENYPRTLFKFFEEKGYDVSTTSSGIYYVKKDGFFDTQVLVTGKLSPENHLWLTSLTRDLSDARKTRLEMELNNCKGDGPLVDELCSSVWEVVVQANEKKYEKNFIKKGEDTMISSPTLDRLLASKYQYERREGRKEGRKEGHKEGRKEGRKDEVKDLIRKKLAKNKPVEVIADEVEEDDIDKIRKLIDEIRKEDAAASNDC